MRVTYVGPDQYGSTDPETGRSIVLSTGDSCEVSDGKAEQMLRDFPDWFERPKSPPAAKPAKKSSKSSKSSK